MPSTAPDKNPEALASAVLSGDRGALARAITLVESSLSADRERASKLLESLLPRAGGAMRIGITGLPGSGKSTLIAALGERCLDAGRRVAVLAVDPSSQRNGGSILGDKTRMAELAVDPRAFVRPSPSKGALGGVQRATRGALALCEAAGFDVVFVETVGVGQSEALVGRMVDTTVLLLWPGGGDELQGIKRGILEVADVVVVHKADGELLRAAELGALQLRSALSLSRGADTPPVIVASSTDGRGLAELWEAIVAHDGALRESGFAAHRAAQAEAWMWELAEHAALDAFRHSPAVAETAARMKAAVHEGSLLPTTAAARLVAAYTGLPSTPEASHATLTVPRSPST